jgi:hypothetical protein
MVSPFGALSLSVCFMGLMVLIVLVAVGFFFNLLVLWGTSKLLNFRKKDLKTAAYATLSIYAVSIIINVIQLPIKFLVKQWMLNLLISLIFFALGLLVSVYIIKRCYNEGFLKALAAYIVLLITTIIAAIIVGLIVGVAAFAFLGASLKSLGAG